MALIEPGPVEKIVLWFKQHLPSQRRSDNDADSGLVVDFSRKPKDAQVDPAKMAQIEQVLSKIDGFETSGEDHARMARAEPGGSGKFLLWLNNLEYTTRTAQITSTAVMGRPPKKIWSKKLDRERRVEVIAREDDLMSFREMKRVSNKDGEFDVAIYESGLYDDIKDITLAVSEYVLNDRKRSRG